MARHVVVVAAGAAVGLFGGPAWAVLALAVALFAAVVEVAFESRAYLAWLEVVPKRGRMGYLVRRLLVDLLLVFAAATLGAIVAGRFPPSP